MPTLRPLALSDAPALEALVRRNRAFLAPWEPVRPASYFTLEGQRADIAHALDRQEADLQYPFVITAADGAVAGRLNINNVIRGAGQMASLGYWVSEDAGGRGLATRAIAEASEIAFGALALHRLEAGTLVHNVRSQRVLEKNGFEHYGLAPQFILIAGRWQDHALFQRLNPRWNAHVPAPSGDGHVMREDAD